MFHFQQLVNLLLVKFQKYLHLEIKVWITIALNLVILIFYCFYLVNNVVHIYVPVSFSPTEALNNIIVLGFPNKPYYIIYNPHRSNRKMFIL